MPVRPFRREDAPPLAELAASCARGEADFVLNPLWERESDLFAEYERHGVDPAEHLLVAETGDGQVVGCSGFVRRPGSGAAGLVCPIVVREERGQGLGGDLLRGALDLGEKLRIRLTSAAIGVRNRAGYSLLTALGFRPARQHFLMRLDAAPDAPKPPSDVALCAATPDDAGAILAIYEECGFPDPRSTDEVGALLTDARHAFAVARRDDRVIAFTEIETHWPDRPWVAFAGVERAHRSQGLGAALVAWSLARQFEGDARSALLLLSPANRNAVRAYEKVGFRRHRLVDVLDHASGS